jgi:polyribonucleotide nucleotidyltransferase
MSKKRKSYGEDPVYDSKEFAAAVRIMGDKNAVEMVSKSAAELKELIAVKSVDITKTKQETLTNDQYRAADSVKKDFTRGMNEAIKPMKVVVDLAALILNERNER